MEAGVGWWLWKGGITLFHLTPPPPPPPPLRLEYELESERQKCFISLWLLTKQDGIDHNIFCEYDKVYIGKRFYLSVPRFQPFHENSARRPAIIRLGTTFLY